MKTNNLRYLLGILIIYVTVAWCLYVGAPLILGTILFGYIRKSRDNKTLASSFMKNIIDTLHNSL